MVILNVRLLQAHESPFHPWPTCMSQIHTCTHTVPQIHTCTHTVSFANIDGLDVLLLQAAHEQVSIPEAAADQAAVVGAVVTWVEGSIAADRKVRALKQLQGHIWRSGFESGKVGARAGGGRRALMPNIGKRLRRKSGERL